MKNIEIRGNAAHLINQLFQTLLVTYLVLLLIEQIWKGVVSNYLNLNWLLVIVILTGILDVFSKHEKRKEEKIKRRDYFFIVILGIIGFFIIKYKTTELGWLSWAISVIAGILIVLLSQLVMNEEEKEEYIEKKSKKYKRWAIFLIPSLFVIACLATISLGIWLFSGIGFIESLRIVFGSVFVLFIPGFVWSFVFFPKTKNGERDNERGKSIDWIERIALGFALSIAIVPLAVFYLNLIGLKINLFNSFLTVVGIIAIGIVVIIIKKKKRIRYYPD